MPFDGKILARARTELERRRSGNLAERQRRLAEVYARSPEMERIDRELRSQMAELVRLTVSRAPDLAERLEALRQSNLALQARRGELLVQLGFPTDYLDEIVSCPICRDTGMDGSSPCRCLRELYNRELTKELGTLLRHGDERFERFDLSLYDSEPLGSDAVSPRYAMEKILEMCRRYAERFPDVNVNLLFQGGTGLGKTYLSACIARVVADKGCSVCYDSAAAALEAFEAQRFARDPETAEAADARVRRMLDCDLMILDDLGTEIVTSLSISALYTLINTRLTTGKKTIVSTNCSDEELQRKYSPQIVSRLKGEFLRLPFVGRDIRLMKR
ncbi:MAG: ATP-binding protein [Oscillospiraceae bacterium]|nr:ATP-binding protein [Oscillospiraceae bacterium]